MLDCSMSINLITLYESNKGNLNSSISLKFLENKLSYV
jgi:hypothetical protein